jgi:hypothetical protein
VPPSASETTITPIGNCFNFSCQKHHLPYISRFSIFFDKNKYAIVEMAKRERLIYKT